MVAPTQVRAGRATALLAAFQSAKGTPASDFTAAGAKRLWTEEAGIAAGREFGQPDFMDSFLLGHESARHLRPEALEGSVRVLATPASLQWLLRSNYGAYAAGSFTLASQIAATQWLTLGWVENAAGGTYKFARLRDIWFHKLNILAQGPVGRVILEGHYAARASLVQALNGGGITLPSNPMAPDDLNVFPASAVHVYRDPAGSNVDLRIRSLRLTFDQGLGRQWDMAAAVRDVFKRGKMLAELELISDYSDETWAILTNARAGTDDRYQIVMTVGSSTFTVNLYNVAMEVEPLGHDGISYKQLRAVGRARRDASGNYVTVSLT